LPFLTIKNQPSDESKQRLSNHDIRFYYMELIVYIILMEETGVEIMFSPRIGELLG
jgi:hypothetical protein